MTKGSIRISAEAYHADRDTPEPSLSSTTAKLLIHKTPRHAFNQSQRLNPNWRPTVKKAFDIGKAAHRLVLGVGEEYRAYPPEFLASNGATNTKLAKQFEEDCRAAGIIPLKEKEIDAIHGMAEAVSDHLSAMGIKIDPARSEIAAYAKIDGVLCRMMGDNIPEDPRLPILDLKTKAGSVSTEALIHEVRKRGYDISAQHYLRVWKEATGEDRDMRFVFVEKPEEGEMNPTYEVGVIRLYNDGTMRPASDYAADEAYTGDWFADAEQKLARARRTFRQCLDTGIWPCGKTREAIVGAPVWYRRENALAELEAE